jgi:hypothetical protein
MTEEKAWKVICPNGHEAPLVDIVVRSFQNRTNNSVIVKCLLEGCDAERKIPIDLLLAVTS